MFKKRIKAYIIDVLLVTLILTLLGLFIPNNPNIDTLNEELSKVQTNYLNKDISYTNYFVQTADIMKKLDQNQIIYSILMAVVIIGYFVIWPYYHNGQTIGKKKQKIKVVKDNNEKVSLNDLLLRNMIINNLGYLFIQLIVIFILPSESYYITTTSLSFIQFIIMITSFIMIDKRRDKKGIHDLIVKTKVVKE